MTDIRDDLRVRKTKRAIFRAFSELLKSKSIDKISVTELAREAEINKGTFYLHYRDIYDLYDSYLKESIWSFLDEIDFYDMLFEDAGKFLSMLFRYFDMRLPDFPEIIDRARNNRAPDIFADMMREKIYETGSLARSKENDVAIEFFIYATMGLLLQRSGDKEDRGIIADVAAKAINSYLSKA